MPLQADVSAIEHARVLGKHFEVFASPKRKTARIHNMLWPERSILSCGSRVIYNPTSKLRGGAMLDMKRFLPMASIIVA